MSDTERAVTPQSLLFSGAVGGRSLGGRSTVEDPQSVIFNNAFPVLVAPREAEADWKLLNLDTRALRYATPARILELLADLSPDISRALWDFLRMCNPGFEIVVTRPGSEKVDKPMQAALDSFINLLSDRYGSFDVVVAKLFMAAFLRGAFFCELVLDQAGRLPIDLATPDPDTVRFRRVEDPDRGQVFQMGQWQAGNFIVLDRPTVRYVPVDQFPGKPYGRPPAAPAIFTTLFTLGMLHDLRRVIAQQGYPRLDVEIDLDRLLQMMPPDIKGNPKAWGGWIDTVVKQVNEMYSQLEPDQAYVHTNVVKVNRPVGTTDASSLGAIGGITDLLEKQAIRALKTMPVLMGSTDGASEANANRQWEIHVAGIKSLQHHCETMLGRLFTLALQAQGLVAVVTVTFAELRAAEMFRDAQTKAVEIANMVLMQEQGWEDQDSASEAITGHPPLGDPAPDPTVPTADTQTNPDPGSDRYADLESMPPAGRSATEPRVSGTVVPTVPIRAIRQGEPPDSLLSVSHNVSGNGHA